MNKAQSILKIAQECNNSNDMLRDIYKINSNDEFDAIIIAPSWLPEKILKNYKAKITCLTRHAYFGSYLVEYDDIKIAWIQCASGANNLIDTCLTLANSIVDKIIFVGAVGALKEDIQLGDIATPIKSYSYEGGSLYLYDNLDISNFGKKVTPHNLDYINQIINSAKQLNINIDKKTIFCTDSIICEYSHLKEIRSLNPDLIEMETASFYKCMEMMNKNGIALLCVSDNSSTNISLVARTEEQTLNFHRAREKYIPELIKLICKI